MLKAIISTDKVKEFKKWLEWADKFVIVTHTHPDGDAIGSSLALWHFLRIFGKTATVIVPNAFPDFLEWMSGTNEILRFDKKNELVAKSIEAADVVCCLDFNTLSRIDDVAPLVGKSSARKIMIDHHPNPDDGFDISISETKVSSTSELVFRLICQLGCFKEMTKECADCICAGIMTDTGGLAYNSNDKDLYFIVAELISKGVDKDAVYRRVFHNYSLGRLRLMGFVLYEKMLLFPKYHAALITLSKEEMERFRYIKGDSEGFVNLPLQIKGIVFSAFLREDTEKENRVNVSLRSVGSFPCNSVAAEFFNGGGHVNASGGEIFVSLNEAVKIFKKSLEKFAPLLTS